MRLRIALAAAASLSLALVACGGDDSGSDPATEAPTTAPATAETTPTTPPAAGDSTTATTATPGSTTAGSTGGAAESEVAVDIADFAFDPADIHVAVGGTVTWTNSDDQQHTATGSGTFDTGAIAPDASASFTFETAGDVSYICSFHPFMKGTVVVG